jgi:putative CocE/NonD family hydrolase
VGPFVRPLGSPAARAFAAACRLPPPVTRRVDVHRGLSVRARDGVILRTDVYQPSNLDDAPAVLVRTPYGRGGPAGLIARTVAEQGYRVVVQSCRGTADSGGEFEPLRRERDDGLDAIAWLRAQPWYRGGFAMYGPSYVGFTQWAVAADAGPDLKALATAVTAASFRDATYAGGGFSLDTVLTWSSLLDAQRRPLPAALVDLLRGQPRLKRALAHPVLAEADVLAVGVPVPHFQEWLRETAADAPYWAERGHNHRLAEVDVPVLMVGGWYDIFLPWQLADYAVLRAAGRAPRLVIGPWHHGSLGLMLRSIGESVRFIGEHLRGDRPSPGEPVRIHVGGVQRWRELPDWPPAHAVREWFLRPDGGLAAGSGPGTGRRRFRYDPTHPTPAVGGPRLTGTVAGVRDNRALEARPDVLVYSSEPLAAPVEAVGPVRAVIRTTSSVPYFDVFVRLCDVAPGGKSVNLCDGFVRVVRGAGPGPDADGVYEVPVDLWPVAHVFAAGHRIRVQVSGGAHPRWSRNPGTGAALTETGPMVTADREVLAGSVLHLPT